MRETVILPTRRSPDRPIPANRPDHSRKDGDSSRSADDRGAFIRCIRASTEDDGPLDFSIANASRNPDSDRQGDGRDIWEAVPVMTIEEDLALRALIMGRLAVRVSVAGGYLTRAELSAFDLGAGHQRRLIDTTRGIWNPRDLNGTLSILSSPNGPYDDREVENGLFRYDYRAGSIKGDNTKLRRAGDLALPLILLRKIPTGEFIPIFPVYVIGDDDIGRQFTIAVDEALRLMPDPQHMSELERRYAERLTRYRLHQSMFRGMVVRAYEVHCAVCHLRHGELLDAAHIIADSDEAGLAMVTNGLALCKLHHAAYDRNLMGIDPDYSVQINTALLDEVDGPMLKHGLQEMHGATILLPTNPNERPDRERLQARFELFRAT